MDDPTSPLDVALDALLLIQTLAESLREIDDVPAALRPTLGRIVAVSRDSVSAARRTQEAETLYQLEDGQFVRDLEQELRDAHAACQGLSKPVEITIKIQACAAGEETSYWNTSITSKAPRPQRRGTTLYTATGGRTSQYSQKQQVQRGLFEDSPDPLRAG